MGEEALDPKDANLDFYAKWFKACANCKSLPHPCEAVQYKKYDSFRGGRRRTHLSGTFTPVAPAADPSTRFTIARADQVPRDCPFRANERRVREFANSNVADAYINGKSDMYVEPRLKHQSYKTWLEGKKTSRNTVQPTGELVLLLQAKDKKFRWQFARWYFYNNYFNGLANLGPVEKIIAAINIAYNSPKFDADTKGVYVDFLIPEHVAIMGRVFTVLVGIVGAAHGVNLVYGIILDCITLTVGSNMNWEPLSRFLAMAMYARTYQELQDAADLWADWVSQVGIDAVAAIFGLGVGGVNHGNNLRALHEQNAQQMMIWVKKLNWPKKVVGNMAGLCRREIMVITGHCNKESAPAHSDESDSNPKSKETAGNNQQSGKGPYFVCDRGDFHFFNELSNMKAYCEGRGITWNFGGTEQKPGQSKMEFRLLASAREGKNLMDDWEFWNLRIVSSQRR